MMFNSMIACEVSSCTAHAGWLLHPTLIRARVRFVNFSFAALVIQAFWSNSRPYVKYGILYLCAKNEVSLCNEIIVQ